MQRTITSPLPALLLLLLPILVNAAPIRIVLPTDNDALFRQRPDEFYMFVDRDFEGKKSSPWEGGQFGFVRTPVRIGGEIVYSRFHEGIDIAPVRRDAAGEPLDDIRAVANGRVVHVSDQPGRSNYGRYIVLEHQWDGSTYYSLYAHLGSTAVQPGQTVQSGTVLGRMGYTGRGIDRRRAHLHLEIGIILNSQYQAFYAAHGPQTPNYHGIYNGMNLRGFDVARMLVESHERGIPSIAAFVAAEKPFYSILVPNQGIPDLAIRYPWLTRGTDLAKAPTHEFIFTQNGFPLAIQASQERVTQPTIGSIRRSRAPYSTLTLGRVGGSGDSPALTDSGQRYIRHLLFPHGE